MNLRNKVNHNRLYIFSETKRSRILVGELTYDANKDVYILKYDKKYARSKHAIALGPGLDLFTEEHVSRKGELFPVLQDRIPVRENSAYRDYCESQGISIDEKNPIILLGTIGRRGPSSFVFELAYESDFSVEDIVNFRNELGISQNDMAICFGIKKITLQRIEIGISHDQNVLNLLEIYLSFPEVAIWQLRQRRMWIHDTLFWRMLDYFTRKTVEN